MLRAATIAAVLAALAMAQPAGAHQVRHHGRTLQERASIQRWIIKHDAMVISHFSFVQQFRKVAPPSLRYIGGPTAQSYRFHKAQLRWTRRELRETLAAIKAQHRARPPTTGLIGPVMATWYGPGFYGHGTSTGRILTTGSWWTAHMTLPFHTMLTICDVSNRRCAYHVPVEDRGAFSASNFDLAPGVASHLGGYYTHTVKYRIE